MPNVASPYSLPGEGWVSIAKRAWAKGGDDNIGLIAAGVGFYGFLAMVPLMAATVLIYGLVADPATVGRNMQGIAEMLPAGAADIVREQLTSVVETSSSKKGFGLIAALAVAFFSARNGAGALIIALNLAFDCDEGRSFIWRNLTALAITVGGAVLAVVVIFAMTVLSALGDLWQDAPAILVTLGKLAAYLLLGAAVAGGAALLFRHGPSCETAPLKWLSPGSIFAAAGLALLTFGFGIYVSNFGNYNATYGSLGAVVVLLTWLWLSAYVLLLGAEFNAAVLDRSDTPDT